MSKLPPKTDFPQFDTTPEIDFASHWKAKGREMLAEPIWRIKLWLSELPPEDYDLSRPHIANGLNTTPEGLDRWRDLSFEEKSTLVKSLTDEEYENERKNLGDRFGLRVAVLDGWRKDAKESAKASQKEKNKEKPKEPPLPFPVDSPWPEAVDLAAVLTEIREILGAHMAMDDWQVKLIAPWIALTYFRSDEELRYAPLLGISSPVLQCGKSRLLGLIQKLCHNSLPRIVHFTRRHLSLCGQVAPHVDL